MEFNELKKQYGNVANVVMTGSVSNVNEYLQASDIYITSSKSEGLPNGVLEAMAVGLPVIMSDIEQHKEVFNQNNKIGRLYRIGDANDCIQKILSMKKEVREFCGEEAYQCAHECFGADQMSAKYQAEYIRICSKNG